MKELQNPNLRDLGHIREDTAVKSLEAVTGDDGNLISQTAFSKVKRNLTKYGNDLSPKHEEALSRIISLMTNMSLGVRKGRFGIPLPIGGGKTQAAICWSWAIWKLKAPLSVVIACGRIDNLREIKEELLKLGVSEDAVGVLHSEVEHPLAATERNDQRQILLVTHARIRGGEKKLGEYAYQGQIRSLTIYDESLITTDHWSIGVGDLVGAVGDANDRQKWLGEEVSDARAAAYEYLEKLRSPVVAEMQSQQAGAKPSLIHLPPCPVDFTPSELVGALRDGHQDKLGAAIENAGGQARGLQIQGNDGFVWFEVKVPDQLQNIVVLDASLVVRMLPTLNNQIEILEDFPSNITSYEKVTLNYMDARSGRGEINDILCSDNRGRLYGFAKEIAHIINMRIPKNEAINIFTFKDRGRKQYQKSLKRGLAKNGVDLDAEVLDQEVKRPRINVRTWGQETATNDFAYAPHTIFVGVLHREKLDLGASTVAAHRDLLTPKENLDKIHEIMASEVAHSIYQAAGRSSIRYSHGGKADQGTIWLATRTPGVLELIKEVVFPGIHYVPWLPLSGDWMTGETNTAQVARMIVKILEDTPGDVRTVSSRQIRKKIENVPYVGTKRPVVTDHVFKDAQSLLALSPPDGWSKEGRSWERLP